MNPARILATAAIVLGSLLPVASTSSPAQTFTYLGKDGPLFSITLPDGWDVAVGSPDGFEVELDGGRTVSTRLVECSGSERAVWFGLWAIDGVADLDTAERISRVVESEFVSQAKRLRTPKDFEVMGTPVRTIEGTAEVEDEDEATTSVRYTTVLFKISKNAVAGGTYLAEPDGEEASAKELAAIIASLRVVGSRTR